jgi:glycosyltransferase involved in cell wall biosynthesis
VVLSLHTSYATARPHKPEWLARPLYDHFMVRRMIAAEARALASARVVLANSKVILADLEAAYGLSVDPGRVVLAPHGTEDLLATGAPPPRHGGFRVLFVGRFEPRKGFDLAARAAMRLLAEVPEAELVFAGGFLDDAAKSILAEAGAAVLATHPRVRFAGVLDRAALQVAYRDCDLVLMPSRYESFGLVAIEAMSAAKPVVALAAGGLVEVVTDGVDGVLVPDRPEAAAELAAALVRLARAPEERIRMATAARRAFEERFTVDAMVDAVEPAFLRAAALVQATRRAVVGAA